MHYRGGEALQSIAAWLTDSDTKTTAGRDAWSAQVVATIPDRERVSSRYGREVGNRERGTKPLSRLHLLLPPPW